LFHLCRHPVSLFCQRSAITEPVDLFSFSIPS
jgi:hypothetical protein